MNRTFCFMMSHRSCHEAARDNSLLLISTALSDFPFANEDGDALGESLGRLGVETPPKFERVRAQSFAAFTDQPLELRQLIAQRFIAAFFSQARPKEIQIVLASQQFA